MDFRDPLGRDRAQERQRAGDALAAEEDAQLGREREPAGAGPVGVDLRMLVEQEVGDAVQRMGDRVLEQPARELADPVVRIAGHLRSELPRDRIPEGRLDVPDRADLPPLDAAADFEPHRVEELVVTEAEVPAMLLGHLNDAGRLDGIQREGLLDVDVAPCLKNPGRETGVRVGGVVTWTTSGRAVSIIAWRSVNRPGTSNRAAAWSARS